MAAQSLAFATNKTRIIGGVPGPINMYPYAAFLVDKASGIVCGGTLINQNWILTAAHCMVDTTVPNVRVIIGSRNIRQVPGVNIKAKYVHPEYNRVSQDNDICLIELLAPSSSTPVIINTSPVPDNIFLKAIGWGIESNTSQQPSTQLMQVDLQTIPAAECRKSYPQFVSNQDGPQICTGNTPGRDTCLGDSGGPLLRKVTPAQPLTIDSSTVSGASDTYQLVGITSFGAWPITSKNAGLCASSDVIGIYTSVAKYLPFITSITNMQFVTK
ncbi:Plasma kallikrein [Smittium mucronatum]|uniref:Plasma kallikrein n=1 Tax=Smittium mucronatum TaxID=133383 RepID=A0A1R0GTR2_9FUNG|nr:Plasma kallikrein [Smittium mucronatum]